MRLHEPSRSVRQADGRLAAPPELLDAIAAKATEQMSRIGTLEMSGLAWAFGKAGHRVPSFFRAYAREVTRCSAPGLS